MSAASAALTPARRQREAESETGEKQEATICPPPQQRCQQTMWVQVLGLFFLKRCETLRLLCRCGRAKHSRGVCVLSSVRPPPQVQGLPTVLPMTTEALLCFGESLSSLKPQGKKGSGSSSHYLSRLGGRVAPPQPPQFTFSLVQTSARDLSIFAPKRVSSSFVVWSNLLG